MPHDGVAALAVPAVVSTPAVPTPPTKASVVAAASTLLLMDMEDSSLGTPQPCPAHGRVELAPAARVGCSRIARHAAGSRWPDQAGLSGLIGLVVPWGLSLPMRRTRDTRRWLTRERIAVAPAPSRGTGATVLLRVRLQAP